jgi:hypothetical protein
MTAPWRTWQSFKNKGNPWWWFMAVAKRSLIGFLGLELPLAS